MATACELRVDTSATSMDMAEAMFGSGIKIVSASYSGAETASGIYSEGDANASAITPSDTGVILSTGDARDITNSIGDVNIDSATSTDHWLAGDEGLSEVSGQVTYDAAVFEAEFVPVGETLTMQIVFSSEEYLEFADSGFNDAVGIWVNGRPAEMTVGDGAVSIDTIHDGTNQSLYVDNAQTDDAHDTDMDGFTVTLTLKATVKPGEVNTIKIAIADAGDGLYDSNLLIPGSSIQTALIAEDDEVVVQGDGVTKADLLENDTSAKGVELKITHINGQSVSEGRDVILPSGEIITVLAGGVITVGGDGDLGVSTFSYTAGDSDGNTDTALVEGTTAPYFVAGSLVDTPDGACPAELLEPGDLVLTRDHGPQPVQWVGITRRKAIGVDAPIRFEAGALGAHSTLEVSPNHRILLISAQAELLFGQAEILVKAKNMINGHTIRQRVDGQSVQYVHILFDRHEIVTCNGVPCESYHPGDQTIDAFDAATRDEIFRLFPLMGTVGLDSYGPSARTALRHYEALALYEVANQRFPARRRLAN